MKLLNVYAGMLDARIKKKLSKLNFAITYKCPAKCKSCGIWKIYKKTPGLKAHELKIDEIEKIASTSLIWLSITGGEPFTRRDVDKIAIAFFPKMLNITTNGFSPRTIERGVENIADSGIQSFINVSIDGPPELHKKLRGIDFAKSLDTLKRLDELSKQYPNLSVSFEFTLTPWNPKRLGDLYKYLESSGLGHTIPPSTVTLMHSGGLYKTKTRLVMDSDVSEALRLALSRTPRNLQGLIKRAYLKGAASYLKNKTPPAKCSAGANSAFLDPYGNLMPCIMAHEGINLRNFDYNLKIAAKKISKRLACPKCWTPCEHYQSLIFNIPELALAIIS